MGPVSTSVDDIRSKPIDNLNGDRTWKDTVVRECICGSGLFYILACFSEEGEISGYYTEAICYGCNGWVKVPTPIDGEN